MFGAFDISFCPNKTCPHWASKKPCGRSLKNFEGINLILSMCSFEPEADGTCKYYMEPRDWKSKVEPWMLEMAERYIKEHETEKARRGDAISSGSLSIDDLDSEV